MRKYLFLLAALFLAAAAVFTTASPVKAEDKAEGIEKADKFFNDRIYSKAIEEYKPFLQAKKGDIKYKAELKTVMAYYYQHKYDQAIKHLYLYDVPSNDTWKARYYLIKYALLANSSNYNSPMLEETETDPVRFTQSQKETIARQVLDQLWDMRKKLASMPYEYSKPYLLPTNNYYDDSVRLPEAIKHPTLFDYVIPLWKAEETRPLEEIYEQAYKIKGSDREAAMELWHLKRIDLIEPKAENPALEKTNWLLYIAGIDSSYDKAPQVKPYIFKAHESIAKAKAAYEAAYIFENMQMYEEAIQAIDYCMEMPLNAVTDSCKNLKQQIINPFVSVEKNIISAAPEKDYKLTVTTRNIDKFYLHIFKLNLKDLKESTGKYFFNPYALKNFVKPIRTLGISVSYGKPYTLYDNDITIPAEKAGFYAIVLSTDKDVNNKKEFKSTILVNLTDIALTATAYAKPKNLAAQSSDGDYYNIYSLDPKTGLPKGSVKIESNLSSKPAYTSKEGLLSLKKDKKDNYFSLNALGYLNNSYAIISDLNFNKAKKNQYILALNTDMAVYKTGSTIKAQLTAAELNLPQGYKLAEGKSASITLHGPNGDILNEKTVKLDSMGSASYSYQLPKDIILGNYELIAQIGQYRTFANVSVEAFKAPEFKVNLAESTEPIKYGVPFDIQGNALYYYGLNTAGARVKFTIYKESFYPFFWRHYQGMPQELVKTGETYTDRTGAFKITFTPTLKQKGFSVPEKYTVNVVVTDMVGNSVNAKAQYIASAKTAFFQTEKATNFFRHDRQSLITVKMQDINGKPLNGTATVNIYSATTPESWSNYSNNNNDNIIYDLTKNKLVRSEQLEFKDGQPSLITVPPLKEGWYITEFIPEGQEEPDPNDNDVFLVVNIKDPAVNLPDNTIIPEDKVYYPGETAVILLASPKAKSNKYVEIYKDQFLVYQKTLTNDGPSVLQFPITQDYLGGINVRWFSLFDYNYYTGSDIIEVPYPNKELKVKISGNEVSFPGAKKSLTLNVTDNTDNPVDARAFVTVYDKAIDYYKKHSFNMLNTESGYSGYNDIASSLETGSYDFLMQDSMLTLNTAMAAPKMAFAARGVFNESADDTSDAGQPEIRSDFTSNALWLPALNIKKGEAKFTFTLPQNIGQWNVLAAAFTKDIKTGKTDFGFITRKDIMLSLEAPRFLRNGDEIQLQALVSNTTDKPLTTQVKLTASYDCEDDSDDCRTKEYPSTSITIAPQSQNAVKWNFKAPQEGSYIMFSASAKSGVANDGEIKTVPLLPSKQQLTASTTVALKKGPNKIDLRGISKGAELEAVHLTVSPSLLMPIVNAMPLLVKASNTMATYVADSYLPLAIFDKIYNSYPKMKEIAAQLPARDSVAPAWNLNEKLLINNIAQSPWYMLSKGYNNKQDIINLFDANLVAKHKQQAEKDLAAFQNEDGGYAWVKGGKSSILVTLNVLESFAQARRYGVQIDENAVKEALNYLTDELSEESTNVYRAYIYTSFPKEWNEKTYQIAQNTMREFEITPQQTPVNYAYAAMVYKNLGQDDAAQLQIKRMFDLANISEVSGISWSFEDRSWQWFEDDVNLHATALKATYQINPNDERIEGLVKWLIFNEKSQAWGNPQSAAKAVYALLEVMLRDSSMQVEKVFTTDWNLPYSEKEKMYKIRVKPFALDSNLTLSAYDSEITENALNASINKAVFTNEEDLMDIEDYATITALFTTDTPQASSRNGLITIDKDYYLIREGKAILLKDNDTINPGDEIQVRLTVQSDAAFDFVVISDPKPAAFETDALLSGWKYQQLYRYEELQDNVTNFFIPYLPKGTYELNYTLRPTAAGQFANGAAILQSMFMPEITAHSNGFKVKVK